MAYACLRVVVLDGLEDAAHLVESDDEQANAAVKAIAEKTGEISGVGSW